MAVVKSKIVRKDNHLLFEDGRFYVTETPYKDGRPTDWPKKIDVTDDVIKAVMPKQKIDIDKFVCDVIKSRDLEECRIYGHFYLFGGLKWALKQQGIVYDNGSLYKANKKEKEPATNVEFSVWPKELVEDTVREAAENTDKVLDELGTHPLFKSVYDKGYENGKDETLKKALEWLQVYCSMYFWLDLDPKEECYCIKSDIAQLLNDLYKEIKGE